MSDSDHAPQPTTVGDLQQLKTWIHDIGRYLDAAGNKDAFRTRDLPFEAAHNQRTLTIMRQCNLVTVTREKHNGENACIYHWNERVKQQLEEYRDSLDTLPCGHRAHIHNTREGRFGCRYCDEQRDYPRELIDSLL